MRFGFLRIAPAILLAVLSRSVTATEPTLVERLGYPRGARLLIVHADDVGMCHSVNVATVEAMARGWVTSAGIMVPCPWFPEAVALAKANPRLDFGLHLTLNSEWRTLRWRPLTPRDQVRSLVDGRGFFWQSYVETLGFATAREVEKELRAQVRRALDSGLRPTHLDSHMGTLFMDFGFFEAYRKVAHEFRIPYLVPEPTAGLIARFDPRRRVARRSVIKGLKAEGDVVLDRIVLGIEKSPPKRAAEYARIIRNLKPGVTEILIHCGEEDDELKAVMHNWAARVADAQAFGDPRVKRALDEAGVTLIDWTAIRNLQYGK